MTAKTPRTPAADAVRRPLLELHRALLDEQRKELERIHGRLTPLQALQAATEDQRFGWLGAVAALITELDAARTERDDARTDAVLTRVRALLVAPDPATAFGYRYLAALQQHPAVVLAHRDLVAALG